MRIVENLNELNTNIKMLDNYLNLKTEPEYSFGLDIVKKGICFVAVKCEDAYRFYPSRFIGYVDNSRNAHLSNEYKNGRETNPEISKILECKPMSNLILDNYYREYCESLGFIANDKGSFGVERKYWELQ